MTQENNINNLFEMARSEAPRLDYNEVAQSFVKTIGVIGALWAIKYWIINNIGLNTFVMTLSTTIISSTIWIASVSGSEPTRPSSSIVTPIVKDNVYEESTPIEFIEEIELNEEFTQLMHKGFTTDVLKPNENLQLKTPIAQEVTDSNERHQPFLIPEFQTNEEDTETGALIVSYFQNDKTDASGISILANDDIEIFNRDEFFIGCCSSKKESEYFVEKLTEYGIEVDFKGDWDRKGKALEKIKMTLKHENGLDLKMKIEGFCKFTMICEFDNDDNLVILKFKIDDQEITDINLTNTGTYTYKSSKN